MNRCIVILMVNIFVVELLGAQDPKIYSIKGDKLYKDSNFMESEEAYRKANDLKPEFKNLYNIGNCLYQQGRTKEAADAYEKSLHQSDDHSAKSKAYYNLGNALFNQKDYDKSIKAYQDALKINPGDQEAKQNLVLAKRQKQIQQQQQQQQQNDQNQKDDQNKQNQESKEDQKDQKNNKQQEKNKNQDQSSTQDKQKEQDKKSASEEENKDQMNKEQAEQLLRMINDRDKKTRERIQKAQSKSPKREKDW